MVLGVIQVVLFIIGAIYLLSSKNLSLNVVVGILMIIFIVFDQYKDYKKSKDFITTLKNNNIDFTIYKERLISVVFFPTVMILNSILIVNTKITDKNIELIRSNAKEISGLFEYIKIATSDELASIVIWGVVFIMSTMKLIFCINRNVILKDNELFFSDGISIDLQGVIKAEYIHQYFPIKNTRILKIKSILANKKVVVDVNDDSLKTHIDNCIKSNQ